MQTARVQSNCGRHQDLAIFHLIPHQLSAIIVVLYIVYTHYPCTVSVVYIDIFSCKCAWIISNIVLANYQKVNCDVERKSLRCLVNFDVERKSLR